MILITMLVFLSVLLHFELIILNLYNKFSFTVIPKFMIREQVPWVCASPQNVAKLGSD